MRNPHRMAWDVPAGPGSQASLLAFVIGSNVGSPVRYETINIIRRGANYGYPLREGPEFKPESPIYGPLSADNTLPLRISDTVVLDQRVPIQDSALAYRTGVEGLAIANGFVYRGKRWPATSRRRRLWRHHQRKTVLRADGGSRLPPRTAIPPRWRRMPRSRRTFPPLCRSASGQVRLRLDRLRRHRRPDPRRGVRAGPAPAPATGRLHLRRRPGLRRERLHLRRRPGLRRDRLRPRPAPGWACGWTFCGSAATSGRAAHRNR